MRKNLMAYTVLGCDSPPFLSANLVDGNDVEIHMRGDKNADGSQMQVTAKIPLVLFELMIEDAVKNLKAK